MSKHFEDDMPSTMVSGFRRGELQMMSAGTGTGKSMIDNEDLPKLLAELWASDEASALTNRAARMIEKLSGKLQRLEQKSIEDSWRRNPDRMGGQFTDEEVLETLRNKW
jgi:hypothetical protein